MKKLFALPLAAVVALAACNDLNAPTALGPDAASFSAVNVDVTPMATFAIGSGGQGDFEYTGSNQNIRCDSEGLAWNNQSNRRVPGQDKFCTAVSGGAVNYSIEWNALYTQTPSNNLNLIFQETPTLIQVQRHHSGNINGEGTTPSGNVFAEGSSMALGTATVDLSQFTTATWADNETAGGWVCLQNISNVEVVVTIGSDTESFPLKSFCW